MAYNSENVGSPGGSLIGIGIQNAWGTAAARTMWIDGTLNGMADQLQGMMLPTLGRVGSVDAAAQRSVVTGHVVEGTLEFFLAYDDASLYLVALLLGVFSTGSATEGVYPHSIRTGLPDEWQEYGITLERCWGERGGTADGQVFDSCVVTGGTITITPDQPVQVSLSVIGRKAADRTTVSTPTYRDPELVMGHHCGGLTWGPGGSLVLDESLFRSATLEVQSTRDRRQLVGSLYTQYPLPSGVPTVTLQVERDHDTLAVYTAYKARTRDEATMTFTGSSPNTVTIALPNAEIDHGQYSDPVTGPGVTAQSFTLAGLGTASEASVTIEVENERSSLGIN